MKHISYDSFFIYIQISFATLVDKNNAIRNGFRDTLSKMNFFFL